MEIDKIVVEEAVPVDQATWKKVRGALCEENVQFQGDINALVSTQLEVLDRSLYRKVTP